MSTTLRITTALRRLGELELERGPLASALSPLEKQGEIQRLRGLLPVSILEHHDRLLQRGHLSIAVVRHGACPVCRERLPRTRLARRQTHPDLDVCDHCGVFLVLPTPVGAEPDHSS